MELSNGVIQERQQFIKSMTEFVEEKQKRLNEVLERLGLSAEELLKVSSKLSVIALYMEEKCHMLRYCEF